MEFSTQDPKSARKNEKKSGFSCRTDKKFLPIKAFYFFSQIAFATVQPYVVVYLKTQGLSAGEAGVLAGTTPFLAFLAQPLLGAFADRWHKHKAVLIAAGLVTGVFQLMFVFVPARDSPSSSNAQMTADAIVFCGNQTWPAPAVCDVASEKKLSSVAEYDEVMDGYLDFVAVHRSSGETHPTQTRHTGQATVEGQLEVNQSTSLPASYPTIVRSVEPVHKDELNTAPSKLEETPPTSSGSDVHRTGTTSSTINSTNQVNELIPTTSHDLTTSDPQNGHVTSHVSQTKILPSADIEQSTTEQRKQKDNNGETTIGLSVTTPAKTDGFYPSATQSSSTVSGTTTGEATEENSSQIVKDTNTTSLATVPAASTSVEALATVTSGVIDKIKTQEGTHTAVSIIPTLGTSELETENPKETLRFETVSDILAALSKCLIDAESVQCQLKCETVDEENRTISLSQHFRNDQCNFTGSDSDELYSDKHERFHDISTSDLSWSQLHDTLVNKTCRVYNVHSFSGSNGSRLNLTCQSKAAESCQIICLNKTTSTPETSLFDLTFVLYFVIYLCAFVPEGLMQPMCNAIVYSMLRDQRHKYGRQRVFATIGYFLTSVAIFVAMHIVTESGEKVYYKGLFINYVFFCWVSSFVVCTIQMPTDVHSDNMLRSTVTLLSTPKIAAFLLVLFFFGIAQASITFLFWFITDLGAPPEVMPLTMVVAQLGEIPTMIFSGGLIRRVGPIPVLCLSVVLMCVAMLCFSFLVNPWFVLPIEPTTGLAFGFMLNSATAYASQVAPPGMAAAAQGLVNGVFDGIGRGVGGVLTGWLFGVAGARTTYRAYAGAGLVVTVVYYILYRMFFSKQRPTEVRETEVDVNDALIG